MENEKERGCETSEIKTEQLVSLDAMSAGSPAQFLVQLSTSLSDGSQARENREHLVCVCLVTVARQSKHYPILEEKTSTSQEYTMTVTLQHKHSGRVLKAPRPPVQRIFFTVSVTVTPLCLLRV